VTRHSPTDNVHVSLRSAIAVLAAIVTLASVAVLAPAGALAAHSYATAEQVAWVRRAATNFVSAELAGNGAGACAILDARLRGSEHHRTCAQRWDARLARILHEPGGKARLHAQERAIPSAAVIVHGSSASIDVPTPLMDGSNRFLWSENCWMLDS
jgi:hypothetical protein